MLNRRGLITGLISLVAAPAIVRVTSIMPVKAIKPPHPWYDSEGWVTLREKMPARPHWTQEWEAVAEFIYPRRSIYYAHERAVREGDYRAYTQQGRSHVRS
jgi:hypothetical protein